jgi:hypothetical protein
VRWSARAVLTTTSGSVTTFASVSGAAAVESCA